MNWCERRRIHMYTKLEISIWYTCKPAYNRLCKSCGTIDYEYDIYWYIFLPKENCEREVWGAPNRVNLSLPVSCRTLQDAGSSEGWWEHGWKGRSSPKVESSLYPFLLEASFGIDRNRGKKKTIQFSNRDPEAGEAPYPDPARG